MLSMTSTDYIIDSLLILSIFRQVRERPSDLRSMLLPIGLVAFAAQHYLTTVPTSGNDIVLDLILGGLGVSLGAICGTAVHLRSDEQGGVLARVGRVAIVAWLTGMGARLAFQLYSSHGGADAITRFSISHHITGANAWTAALVLMALSQVIAKLAVQLIRAHRLTTGVSGAAAIAV
jgi:hypothetical protein